ncbi:major facilitator superfamily domain-containing protein [Lasiosphaeria miniovina]|uniref:Major facilitator superfamily domain-containing protein n=1 Tax=Lasiosphaeria miniovina TaxID=1954250 RepID=A0AA39ZQI2_9PEZI|nr:major facilitator superfamily domain-containing protein [Lasiosphaeria miniovina]KAK0701786.1 major facilitator superfamily domain-containing protein [Lasiosphaeria miniovina]
MDYLPEPMAPLPASGSGQHHSLTHGGNNAFHNFANDYSHISDPNLRRRLALSDIDKVPFGLYHVRAVAVAGVGFFLDSYDIFAINLITTFLGVVFWQGAPAAAANGFGGNYGSLPGPVSTALKASTSAGIVVGQLLFGWLADVCGRRRMYGIELGIIVLSTLNCALASPSQSMSSTGLLVFWRVMMGIGIGGDYPLSAIITSEFAPTRWRGAMMAAVFSMQGMGQLACAVVALMVTAAFKDSFITAAGVGNCDYACQVAADRAWRIIVAVGALPACVALYYRITIPETPRYTFDVAHDVEKADADIKAYMANRSEGSVDPVRHARVKQAGPSLAIPSASWPDLYTYFSQGRNLRVLLGTTLSWFFLDLAFYGLGLNNTVVLSAIGYSHGPTLYHALYNNAVGLIILACAGSLPGYWTAVVTIDTVGRKPLQIGGFAVLTVLFCLLGFLNARLSEVPLLVLYIAAQFFFNLGPNTTTFIVPGECFPTRYRSTGHGLSAASGKIGAILAQVISTPLLANCPPTAAAADSPSSDGSDRKCSPWLDRLMLIFAFFMLCGTATSLLIPETKGVTLEELAGERPVGGGGGSCSDNNNNNTPAAWWKRPFAGGQPAGFRLARSPHMAAGAGPGATGGAGGKNASAWPGSSSAARSPRMGIMTSPELAAMQYQQQLEEQQQNKSGGRGWAGLRRKKKKEDGKGHSKGTTTTSSGGGGGSNVSAALFASGSGGGAPSSPPPATASKSFRSSSNSNSNGYEAGSYSDELPMVAHAGVLPGWGAGWGGRVGASSSGAAGPGAGQGQPPWMDSVRFHDVGSLLK